MRSLETRYPCPVCLGVSMEKVEVGRDRQLILDHCGRCGGIWFDAGELQRLRGRRAELLWKAIDRREQNFRMQCHSCHGFIERNAERCPSCEWKNVLDCPICQQPMEAATHHGVKLDACRSCKGVWFDHEELASIWRLELATSVGKRGTRSRPVGAVEDSALVVLEALSYSPWLALEGMHVAGHVIGASGEALAHAPEAVGGLVEVAGDAATSVFETIVDVISGLFS